MRSIGKFKVVVTELKDGKVASTSVTVGAAKELGIKDIEELTKRGPGFEGHL